MPRPAVVLDTNVVVSAHLNLDGFERFVLDMSIAGTILACYSDSILHEYRNVLLRPKFGLTRSLVELSLELIVRAGRRVTPGKGVSAAGDLDDNKFLECAEEARAQFLITGNKRHFPRSWRGTAVVSAREFVEILIPELE